MAIRSPPRSPKNGGKSVFLPYLAEMSPAPTLTNLSKIAVGMANDHLTQSSAARHPSRVQTTREEASAELRKEDAAERSPRTPAAEGDVAGFGGDSATGTLSPPGRLPALDRGSSLSSLVTASLSRNKAADSRLSSPDSALDGLESLSPDEEAALLAARRGDGEQSPAAAAGSALRTFDGMALAELQRMWETHARAMDGTGKEFVERVEVLHTNLLQAAGRIKDFDLKAMLKLVQEHAMSVRGLVLESYKARRDLERDLSSGLYATAKGAYEHGVARR